MKTSFEWWRREEEKKKTRQHRIMLNCSNGQRDHHRKPWAVASTKNSGWPQEGRRVPNQSRAAVPAGLDDGQERWMPMMPRAPSKQKLESGTLIASGCWFVSGCQRVGALAKWKIHALPSLIEDTKKWEMESSSEQVASLMFWSWHRHRNSSAVPLFFIHVVPLLQKTTKWIAILLHMTSIITPFDDDSAASVEARKVKEQQNW